MEEFEIEYNQEFEIMKKAYDRLEKLYTKEQLKNINLKNKINRLAKEKRDLERLVRAHIELNRKLNEKINILERQAYVDLKTAGNRSNFNADK